MIDALEEDLIGVDLEELSPVERMLVDHLRLLRLDMDEIRLENNFLRACKGWEKIPEQYVEEAVATEYGLDHRAFYIPLPRGKRRKCDEKVVEARYVLYALLHSLLGKSVGSLRENYQNDAWNYAFRWRPVFDLIHHPRPAGGDTQKAYDRYFPRFRAVYSALKESLMEDGKWSDCYLMDVFEIE